MGEGEVNTGGNGDGGGYGSGICSGYGNDGSKGDGSGHGRREQNRVIKEYKLAAIKWPKQKESNSEQN